MNPTLAPSPATLIGRLGPISCVTWLLLLGNTSVCATPPVLDYTKKGFDWNEENSPVFSGGLHEYRRVGNELNSLWREYTAMSDALSHALRDYNLAIRQEERAELARVLAHKHQEAEAAIAKKNAEGAHLSSSTLYGEVARLKELQRQMKHLDKTIGEIPDYRHPEENAMLVEEATAPVNISKALSRGSATLFRKAIAAYHAHIRAFTGKYSALRAFLKDIKMHSEGLARLNLIKQEAELGNFFDTEAPISLHVQMPK